MTTLPKPSIQEAVAALGHRDEFTAILDFIRDERDRFIADFRQVENSNDVMKLAGSVATLDEVLGILTPQKP